MKYELFIEEFTEKELNDLHENFEQISEEEKTQWLEKEIKQHCKSMVLKGHSNINVAASLVETAFEYIASQSEPISRDFFLQAKEHCEKSEEGWAALCKEVAEMVKRKKTAKESRK